MAKIYEIPFPGVGSKDMLTDVMHGVTLGINKILPPGLIRNIFIKDYYTKKAKKSTQVFDTKLSKPWMVIEQNPLKPSRFEQNQAAGLHLNVNTINQSKNAYMPIFVDDTHGFQIFSHNLTRRVDCNIEITASNPGDCETMLSTLVTHLRFLETMEIPAIRADNVIPARIMSIIKHSFMNVPDDYRPDGSVLPDAEERFYSFLKNGYKGEIYPIRNDIKDDDGKGKVVAHRQIRFNTVYVKFDDEPESDLGEFTDGGLIKNNKITFTCHFHIDIPMYYILNISDIHEKVLNRYGIKNGIVVKSNDTSKTQVHGEVAVRTVPNDLIQLSYYHLPKMTGID